MKAKDRIGAMIKQRDAWTPQPPINVQVPAPDAIRHTIVVLLCHKGGTLVVPVVVRAEVFENAECDEFVVAELRRAIKAARAAQEKGKL